MDPESNRRAVVALRPHASNTGALRVTSRSEPPTAAALVDWLDWTEHERSADEVCAWLGGEWEELPVGRWGYRAGRSSGSALVFYDGAPGMGVFVRLPGAACRALEDRGGPDGAPEVAPGGRLCWERLLGLLAPKVARLDVAVDERVGLVQVPDVVAAVRAGSVVSRWRGCQVIEGLSVVPQVSAALPPREGCQPSISGAADAHRARSGLTVYFGSRVSEMYCRIYDKAAQTRSGGHWTRVEVEAKGKRARALASRLAERGMVGVAGVLRSYLDFKVRADVHNRRRLPTAAWWDEFLSAASEEPLQLDPAPERTIESVVEHVAAQYGPSLAAVVEAAGFGVLYDLAEAGRARMRGAHRSMVARHRATWEAALA